MKIKLILLLYDALIRGEGVSRKEFCNECFVSERTFYRYMSELSEFVCRYKPAYVIEVIEPQGKYFLKKR